MRYTMRNLEVLVVHPSSESFKVSNWKVTTVSNSDLVFEKIQTSAFMVLAIHQSINEVEILKIQKLSEILDENIVVLEFDTEADLQKTVKKNFWKKRKSNNPNVVVHDNSFGYEINDFFKVKI